MLQNTKVWIIVLSIIAVWFTSVMVYVIYFAPIPEEEIVIIDVNETDVNDTKPLPPPIIIDDNDTKVDNDTEIIIDNNETDDNRPFTSNFSERTPLT